MFIRIKNLLLKPTISFFSLVLFLLPVFIVNVGARLDQNRKEKFAEFEHGNRIDARLEAMLRDADSDAFVKKAAVKINEALKSEFNQASALAAIDEVVMQPAARIGIKLRSDIYLLEEKNGRINIANYQAGAQFGKAQLTNIFTLLLSLAEGREMPDLKEKTCRKMFAHLFGPRMIPEDVARLFNGRPFPTIINHHPSFFVWDYRTTRDGSIKAWFWILENSPDLEKLVLTRAIYQNGEKNSGFVRLFKSSASDILSAELAGNREFLRIKSDLKKGLKTYTSLAGQGLPNALPIGQKLLYSRQMPDREWLAVFLADKSVVAKNPVWLFLINLFALATGFLLLSTRLIFGKWPQISLRNRFLAVIAFAVLIPIAMSVALSHFYSESWLKSEIYRVDNETRACTLKLELQQQNIESKYLKRFYDFLDAPQTPAAFAKWKHEPEKVLSLIESFFINADEPLVLAGIDVIDVSGEKASHRFSRSLQLSIDYLASFCHSPLFENLQAAMLKKNSSFKLPESDVSADIKSYSIIYEMIMNRDFGKELDKRRGEAIWLDAGNERFGFLQDYYLQADNGFSLQLFFSLKNNYELVFSAAMKALQKDYPDTMNAVLLPADRQENEKWLFSDNCDAEAQEFLQKRILAGEENPDQAADRGKNAVVKVEISKNFPGVIFASFARTKSLHQQYQQMRLYNVFIMVFCFVVAMLLSFVLYLRIIGPINLTTSAVERIAGENFDPVPELIERNDEFGILGQEIANMLTGLRERRQLAAVLSDQVLEAINSSEREASLGTCRKFKGVALVTDIRSFTSISEEFPPEQITSLLNGHFAEMALAITSEGGKIYKFIGDAIEAVFEVREGETHESTSLRAARACKKMLQRLEKIMQRRREINLFQYRIGIGLEFGEFTAGIIGDHESRLDYAILGNPLKSAAELEALSRHSSTKPILCSSEIKKMLETQGCRLKLLQHDSGQGWELLKIPDEKNLEEFLSPAGPAAETGNLSFMPGSGISRKAFFAAGLLVMALTTFNLHGFIGNFARNIDDEKASAGRKFALSMARMLQHENAVFFLSESFLCREAERIGNDLLLCPDKQLPEYRQKLEENFARNGFKFEKLAICRSREEQVKPFLLSGFAEENKHDLNKLLKALDSQSREFARKKGSFDFLLQIRDPELEPIIEKCFGLRTDLGFLHDEMTYRNFPFTIDNQEKVLFWAPLFRIDPEVYHAKTANGAESLFEFPASRQWDTTGIMIARFSLDDCLPAVLHEIQVLNSLAGGYLEIYSENSERMTITEQNLSSQEFELLFKQNFELGGQKFRADFYRKKESKAWPFPLQTLVWAVFLVFARVWHLTVFKGSGFAVSLRKQLSAAILVGIIVPASFLFLAVEGFQNIELQNLQQEELQKINRKLEAVERLQYLFQPFLADRLAFISNNSGLQNLVKTGNENGNALIRKFLGQNIAELEEGAPVPAEIGQAVILRRDGVSIGSEPDPGQDSSSNSIAEGVSRVIFNSLLSGDVPNPAPLAQQAKDEMILESFVHVYRSMFGEKIMAELFSSLWRPVVQNAISSCITVMCLPVPNIENPDYLAVWTAVLTDQRAMLRAAATFVPDSIPVFAEVQIKMGHASYPNRKRRAALSEKMLRWVGHTGQHLEFAAPYAGDELIVVGQIGRIHPKTLLTAFSSLTRIKRELNNSILLAMLLLAVGTIIAYVMVMAIAQNLIKPVRKMIFQTRSLREQSYNLEIETVYEDELSRLCHAFNRMAKMIKEKSLLKSLVSQQAGDLLADAGQHQKARQGFKTRRIVAFINLITTANQIDSDNFSEFAAQMGQICRVVSDCGGDIDKIIGSKMLVFFPEEPEKAICSFLQMVEKLQKIEGMSKARIFVGAHAGEVIAGLLGVGDQCDFTMIGDSVNTAARIEAIAEEMREFPILFSEEILKLANAPISVHKVGSINLKGKKDAVALFALRF